jgi:dUTP pyrophosphatase
MITVKFKQLHPKAILPFSAHNTDTGHDITSVEETIIPAKSSGIVKVGLQVAYIEPGYWFRIEPRSGLGFKHGIQPHLGVIDQNYTGSLDVKLYNFSDKDYTVNPGDRIAQIAFYPLVKPIISWTDEINSTDRGAKGLGSSG